MPESAMKRSLLLLPIFLALAMVFYRWIPDDAYISFRYAQNLGKGVGLVFNPGERVEGFSNLLWTLYLGGMARIGADVVRTAVITSLVFALGAFTLVLFLLRSAAALVDERMNASHLGVGFASASACFFPLIFYSTSGLESSAELFFLLLAALLHMEAERRNRPALHLPSSFSFLIVSLLRPEGILFLIINSVFLLLRREELPRKVLLISMLPFLLYVAAVLAKIAHFGSILPNTYYAKPSASPSYLQPISRGFDYLVRFFTKGGFVILLPFALYPPRASRSFDAWRYMVSLFAGQLFFILFVGGDVLRFDRFAIPLFPFLFTLSYMGLLELRRDRTASVQRFLSRIALFCLTAVCVLNLARIPVTLNKFCIHDWMHSRAHRELGLLLGEILPRESQVVANEVGTIAYYSDLPTIDMIGLTDRTIGRLIYESYMTKGTSGSPRCSRAITEYLLSREPTCIVLPAYQPLSLEHPKENRNSMHPIWYAILSDADFNDEYEFTFLIKANVQKYLYVFTSRGTKLKQPLPTPGEITRCMVIDY